MIDIDWTWIGTLNGWQSVFTIAMVIVALFVVVRFLMRFWPWLKKIIGLTDALGELPEFIVAMKQFRDRTDSAVADIRHEVMFNNGSSVKDAIGRVEVGVKGLHSKVDEQNVRLEAADAALRKDLEDTKPHTFPTTHRPRRPQPKKEKP